ncbi:MAG: M48 family metallopeptidase, partial [Campylobacterales bacterium]|nr:M48 family metallopeptidase [Campylobacterales bacterium]
MKKFSLIVLFSLFFTGCMVQNSYTNREQLMFISQTEEINMGTQAESEILKKEQLSKNIKEKNRVENVGKKLATVANEPNYDWKFYLIEGDTINAFCLPGGKVFVYEGILKIAKSDSELATVISHEIAHALLRHGAERMSIQQTTNMVGVLLKAGLQTQNNPIINQNFDLVYGLASNVGAVLPYSRKHEFEADEL